MDNKQVPEGYEQIGKWYVNRAIPQNARDFLRQSFEVQLKGKISDGEAYFYTKMTRTCFQDGIVDIIRDAVGGDPKKLESLIGNYNSEKDPKVFVDIARLWVNNIANTSESTSTYVEHCVNLSTCEMTPDPFAEINSYLKGKPIDAYERTRNKGIITTTRTLYTRSPIELFIEQVKAGKKISDGEITYYVKITIDCKTREARIDPTDTSQS